MCEYSINKLRYSVAPRPPPKSSIGRGSGLQWIVTRFAGMPPVSDSTIFSISFGFNKYNFQMLYFSSVAMLFAKIYKATN